MTILLRIHTVVLVWGEALRGCVVEEGAWLDYMI